MFKFQIYKYYSTPEIQQRMIEIAKDREIAGTFENGSYSKRPDILVYPKDIEERVKEGIVAFHCSVERWKNPMALKPELSEAQLNNLRKAWDIIIDIDAKAKVEHAKIAAKCVCDFLKDFGVKATVKFSGRRGFHIGISAEALPSKINFKEVSKLYPELLKTIIDFIREKTKDTILDELIKYEGGVASLIKTVESVSELSAFSFLEIEKDWGSRHMFRMPFSLHHKTFLASIPVDVKKILDFEPENAKPFSLSKEIFSIPFLKNKEGEATELVIAAVDWESRRKVVIKPVVEEVKVAKKRIPERKIPEEFFPPCIKNILKGLSDGRKRSIFTLATFLRHMGWSAEEIEKRIFEWNKNNKPPLRDNLIRTQLKWHFRQERELLPANCESELFYKSIDICKPEKLCENVKNPVSYPFKIISLSKTKKKRRKRSSKKSRKKSR